VIRKKLLAPQHFDLVAHYNNLLWELKQLGESKPLEATTPSTPDTEEPTNA
jgi:hypothetical protein